MGKLESSNPNDVTLVIKGAAGQAVDILQVLDSNDTELFSIDKDGNYRHGMMPVSSIVYYDGSVYKAVEGDTGDELYSGASPSTALQTALTAGGTVILRDLLTITAAVTATNVTLIGITGAGLKWAGAASGAFLYLGDNSMIQNLIIDGDTKSWHNISFITDSTNITVDLCEICNTKSGDGINNTGGGLSRVRVSRNYFHDCVSRAMILYGASDNYSDAIDVFENYVNTTGSWQLHVSYATNVVIRDNVLVAGTWGVVVDHGSLGVEICGNRCTEMTNGDMYLGEQEWGSRISCHHNVCESDCSSGNILINTAARYIDVSYNYCANGKYGIYTSTYPNVSAIIHGNFVRDTDQHGIYITSLSSSIVSDNIINNPSHDGAGLYSCIFLGDTGSYGCGANIIHHNMCWIPSLEAGGLYTQAKAGIEMGAESSSNLIYDNQIYTAYAGYMATAIVDAGTSNICKNNVGYITEKSSTATILSGQSAIIVTHGMGGVGQKLTPTNIIVTGSTSDTASLYVDTIGDTYFTIHAAGAVGGNRTVYWRAEV